MDNNVPIYEQVGTLLSIMSRKGIGPSRRRTVLLGQVKKLGLTFRSSQALEQGIHPRDLYRLRDEGALEQISRGFYRQGNKEALSEPDLVIVASRAPHAVICLISALSFHKITTQIPHRVSIAIQKDSRAPRIDWPPILVHKFSPKSYAAGVEEHKIDDISVKVYSVEKTLIDCFKFRNKIGMDVVLEALKLYKESKKPDVNALYNYAKICRVEKAIMPYLEAML